MIMLYDGLVVLALLIIAAGIALPVTGTQSRAGESVWYSLYLMLVWFAYLAWCWARAGQTLGMRAWKVRISAVGGGTPDLRQCLLRFGVSLASAACLGLGFLSALWRRDRACWHDRASATQLFRYRD